MSKTPFASLVQGEVPKKAKVKATFLTLWAPPDSLDCESTNFIYPELFLADKDLKEPD